MKHTHLLQVLSLPFIGTVETLALGLVKEEPLGYTVLMYLTTILRILPYLASREVGLVPVSLVQDVTLVTYQDLGIQINKQKRRDLFSLSFLLYIRLLTLTTISSTYIDGITWISTIERYRSLFCTRSSRYSYCRTSDISS